MILNETGRGPVVEEILTQIFGSGSAVVVIGSFLRKLYTGLKSHISDIVKQETALLSQKINELEEKTKSLKIQIDENHGKLNTSLSEIKVQNASQTKSIEGIQTDIRAALKENNEIIKQVHKSQLEQIGPNLAIMRGKKSNETD